MSGTQKSVSLFLLMILFMPLLCAQTFQQAPTIARGVHLIVGPLDQMCRTLGVDEEKIFAAARRSLEASGLTLNESSEIMFTVAVASLPQREEDKYPIRIELHAGTAFDVALGHEDEAWVIGDLPAVTVVDIPWNSQDTLVRKTAELARTLAVKLKNEILRRRNIEKKAPHESPEEDLRYYESQQHP